MSLTATGMSRAQLTENFPDGVVPGQEPLTDVKVRTMRALEYVVSEYTGKNVIAVSQGAAINALLSLLSDGENGTGKMSLQNACLNVVCHHADNWSIELYNFTRHLI